MQHKSKYSSKVQIPELCTQVQNFSKCTYLPKLLSTSGFQHIKHSQGTHCLYIILRLCSLSPPVVVPVRVKARILKLVALPSPLAAPGVCTLTAVSTPEAKCRANSGYKEITLKRYLSHQSHFYSIIQEYINAESGVILKNNLVAFLNSVTLCFVLTCYPCFFLSGGQNQG